MLKELRKEKGLSQEKAANLFGISRRSLARYEQDESMLSKQKQQFFYQLLVEYGRIDEDHGVLTLDQIKQICADVFKEFNVEFCYLFGSYAKGKAVDHSDVDLLVLTSEKGLNFYDLVEALREKLRKKVDVIDFSQLNQNTVLVKEILKVGIKIYG